MKFVSWAAAILLVALTSACDFTRSPISYGDANSIIVTADPSVWEVVEDSVRSALEPTIFAVRDERTFDITYTEPTNPDWADLRLFRQLLVIGTADDPWVEAALDGNEPPEALPAVVESNNVWANNQWVATIVLPPDGDPTEIYTLLPEIGRDFEQRFQQYMLRRMFASGVNEDLAENLAEDHGFSIVVPRVYRYGDYETVHIFRNDFPSPAELVRSILVTWRSGVTDSISAEEILEWREEVAERYYPRPMVTLRDRLEIGALEGEVEGVTVHGLWESPPERYPGGGAFFSRAVLCPSQNRTYLLDAWLYAPGKDKIEYVSQIRTILGTFRCDPSES